MWCKDYVMTAKQDAVINELNTKVERLIKLYISSLDKNRDGFRDERTQDSNRANEK